jgi:hypothetical protein
LSVPVNILSNYNSSESYYARLSDEQKAKHLEKLRIARQQKKRCNKECYPHVSNISCFFTEFTTYPIQQRHQHANKW